LVGLNCVDFFYRASSFSQEKETKATFHKMDESELCSRKFEGVMVSKPGIANYQNGETENKSDPTPP
jgi:hypothetical protein